MHAFTLNFYIFLHDDYNLPCVGGVTRVKVRFPGFVSMSVTYTEALVTVTDWPSWTKTCSVTSKGTSSLIACIKKIKEVNLKRYL